MKKEKVVEKTAEQMEFEASLAANIESAEALKNKALVKIDRRTYANSVVRRNGDLTETAVIDLALGAYQDLSEACTVQMVTKFIGREFKLQVSRNRLIKHVKDNKFHKAHTEVLDHDVLRFV